METQALTKSRLMPGLKQFRQEGCVSHLIFDPGTREVAIIDPRADQVEEYRAFISENGLKPVVIFETRLHSHHLSGSHLLEGLYRVPIAMSARTSCARASRKLSHGERVAVGRLELEVLETPGVSADSICLYLKLESGGLLFTGDTLLIGNGARIDIPGSEPARLWKSLHEVLAKLPEQTIVFPSHDVDEHLFSTLKIEKSRNPDWQLASVTEFEALKADERPRTDTEARKRLEYNASVAPAESRESHFGHVLPGASLKSDEQRMASISVEKYALKIRERATGTFFLDVREPEEFKTGHMPGATNIPLSELALHLGELRGYRRVYVSCQAGRRSTPAARTLDYLGLPDVVNVSGGFKAWTNAGLTVVTE
jgi:sulfur dioxygenase